MDTFPLGLMPLTRPLETPEPAAALLVSGQVRAFSIEAYLPGQLEKGRDPIITNGASACITDATGAPRWIHAWQEICAAGIPGLAEAILSLTQPGPVAPQRIDALWERRSGTRAFDSEYDEGWLVELVYAHEGQWMGMQRSEGEIIYTALNAIDAAIDRGKPGALEPHMRHLPTLTTLLLPPVDTAHSALDRAKQAEALFDRVLSTLTTEGTVHAGLTRLRPHLRPHTAQEAIAALTIPAR